MKTILQTLSNRRVWAGILGVLVFALGALKISYDIDVPVLAGLLTDLGTALSSLIMAGLALWSYLRPKA